MARIEQTRGFKQVVKYFGGDRRKARKAIRKALKNAGEPWAHDDFQRSWDIGHMFAWRLSPQGHGFWSNICKNY